MKSLLYCLLLPFIGFSTLSAQQKFMLPDRSQSENTVQGRVLVKLTPEAFASGNGISLLGDAKDRYGITSIKPWITPGLVAYRLPGYKTLANGAEPQGWSLRRIMVVEYSSSESPSTVVRSLSRLPAIEYAEPVFRRRPCFTLNDADAWRLWYLDSVGLTQAWDVQRADSSIIVGIVDTGVYKEHEDLQDGVWINKGESGTDGQGHNKQTNGIDDDGNGIIDDWWGYDFGGPDGYSRDNDPSPASESHGTHVAGTACATGNNGKGIAGSGFGARYLAVKVTSDDSSPDITAGFEGILYAAKMGARIINCSWGGGDYSRAEQEVMDVVTHDYNALVVAAAGNDGDLEKVYYPAGYNGAVSVAALHNMNYRASFSHYNYRVDVSAPGEFIYSTIPGGYQYDDGTSMSSPIVSGIAALIASKYPSMTAEQIREVLRGTATDINPYILQDEYGKMGTGRVNAYQALQRGASLRSARVVSYTIKDDNGDGVLDPGESATIKADIKNILNSSPNVTATLYAVTTGVTVSNATFTIGPMNSGQVAVSPDGKFKFTVPGNIAPDENIVLNIAVTTEDRTDSSFITLRIGPTYLTTDLNNFDVTFNSTGNIGFNGVNSDVGAGGDGVLFKGVGPLLYHGGLLIGYRSDHIDDVVRVGRPDMGTGNGFQLVKPYRLSMATDSSVQTGSATFDDAHVLEQIRVGVSVDLKTYEYRDANAKNILIAAYKVRNTNDSMISNLFTGLYLDWDLTPQAEGDVVRLDTARKLGMIHNASVSSLPYIGVALISNQTLGFRAIDNNDPFDNITQDFNPDKKFNMLSGGISRGSIGPTDASFMITGGPVTLEKAKWEEFVFAFVGGNSEQELKDQADRAKALYTQSAVPATRPIASAGTASILPNPFGNRTLLRVVLPQAGQVRGTLYNALGQPVLELVNETLPQGTTDIPVSIGTLPQGVYYYELHTPSGTIRGSGIRQ